MNAHDPRYELRRLKDCVPIASVLAAHGLLAGLRSCGHDALTGPCPLHGGDNPTAFRVQLDRGLWHCFSTCAGGDTVELVRRLLDCNYAAPARHLAQLESRPTSAEPYGRATPACTAAPRRAPSFRPFRRTIPLDPNVPFLQRHKRIDANTAARFEAGVATRSRFLRATVAVRLHDLSGRPLGYAGRRRHTNDITRFGKWRFPTAFPKAHVLYNAHRAAPCRHGGLVVVECPWAVMRLHQAGVPGAVALLGTALSHRQAHYIVQAPSVLLMLDADHAGRRAARTIAHKLADRVRVHIHDLPDGAEPEDLEEDELARIASKELSSSLNPYPCNHVTTEAP